MENSIRYIAAILLETQSTLAINSGEKSLLLDNVLARDANGLPYIPGTSIAGVVHHIYQKEYGFNPTFDLFGCSKLDANDKGGTRNDEKGSRIIISSAHITQADGRTICDGLFNLNNDSYFDNIMTTPERDHVKINHRGVGKKGSKYDRELLYKGIRFGFEIELHGTKEDEQEWNNILSILSSKLFRLGSGTRNGSGKIKVIGIAQKEYDLTQREDLLAYLNKSSNLNNALAEKINLKELETIKIDCDYSIKIRPKDFFFFSTSMPDKDADNTPKKEKVIEWDKNGYSFKTKYLIPATSIKGALAHRTAYHYNQQQDSYITDAPTHNIEQYGIDTKEVLATWETEDTSTWSSDDPRWDEAISNIYNKNFSKFIEGSDAYGRFLAKTDNLIKEGDEHDENNPAINLLFGCKKNSRTETGQIGKILIEDIYLDEEDCKEHIFNHVKIDRFTGGAYDGALFQEKALFSDKSITLNITIDKSDIDEDSEAFKNAIKAFEAALEDLKTGQLPLGGGTTKGYGLFINQA